MKMNINFVPDLLCLERTPASRSNQPYQQQIYMDLHTDEGWLTADLIGSGPDANPSWQVLPQHRPTMR